MMADTKNKNTISKEEKNRLLAVQRYMQFAGAHDDTLILKSGGIRAILEVSPTNFNLKSEPEQNAIITSYQQFLNAINFPVQILIRSRKLDIDGYIMGLKTRQKSIEQPLLHSQMSEYIEYIQKLVQYSDIMEKRFYCIIPADPVRAIEVSMWQRFINYIRPDDSTGSVMQRVREFKDLSRELDSRIGVAEVALNNCGLSTKRMNTTQIIELFYQVYNPQLARFQKMDDIESVAAVRIEDSLIADD